MEMMPFTINNEKNSMKYLLLFLMILATVILIPNAFAQEQINIPSWIKNSAEWWASDQIPDSAFLQGIEYLINEGIMVIPSTETSESSESQEVPAWIKNVAGWWATDAISEVEFVNGIQYLIKHGIIIVGDNSSCVSDLSETFGDSSDIIQDVCDLHESSVYTELIPYVKSSNLNSLGFGGPEFSEIKPPNTYRIFMVGGSTMVGSGGSSDDTTIPGILQKMFDSDNSNLKKIEVINAGFSGANHVTEYNLIKQKLVTFSPDLVIVYDGWNSLRMDYPVEGMAMYWQGMCELGKENNFDTVISLQPIAGFGNKKLTQQEYVNSLTGEDHNGYQFITAKSTYDYMGRELLSLTDYNLKHNNCNVVDLREIYDDVSGPLYWDQGHVSDTGNLLLAEKFYEITNEVIFNKKPTEGKFHSVISKYNSPIITSYLLSKIGIDVDYNQIKKQDLTTEYKIDGNFFYLKNQLGGSEKILVGKDLSKDDLTQIDLTGQNLSGANLSGQDLRKINLTDAILRGANLSFTDLSGKDLSGKDLRGINFHNANLENADLTNITISKIIQYVEKPQCSDPDNELLDLLYTDMCSISVAKNESIRTDFSNANLSGAIIGNSDPSNVLLMLFIDFSGADLTGIEFSNVKFLACKFNDANFSDNNMNTVTFGLCEFSDARFINSKFSNVVFQNVSFRNTEIIDAYFESSLFLNTNFSNADLKGTVFDRANWIGNNILNCKNNQICD